jgi:membrane-bound lytic murein transglycosylase D
MILHILSLYGVVQVLLSAAALVSLCIRRLGTYGEQLKANYRMAALAAICAAAAAFFPAGPMLQPAVKLWAAPSMQAFDRAHAPARAAALHAVSAAPAADYVMLFIFGVLAGAFTVGVLFAARDLIRLLRLTRRAYHLRRVGRVRVLVSEETGMPFSFRIWRRAYIVLPLTLMTEPEAFRLAAGHELQHHRQGDTAWVYALFAIKSISFWNPLVQAWMAWTGDVQELACDEALLNRGKAGPHAYARCLIEVAQTALNIQAQPVCATGLLWGNRRQLLSRRIAYMFNDNKRSGRGRLLTAVAVCAAAAFSAAAFAGRGWIQDRRISAAQAQEMARAAQHGTSFPIVVNEDVVRQLNRFLGTAEGRDFIRKSLRHLQEQRATVEEKVRSYGLPEELMAVPLIESGYQNLEPNSRNGVGAGLWMFIVSTAKKYGLRVDQTVDQRLDIPLETDAAMRYLSSNHLLFRDWQLALLAYNIGEGRVHECIEQTGSRDAWQLIHSGCENDHEYLARFMAALLIMKNPASVN